MWTWELGGHGHTRPRTLVMGAQGLTRVRGEAVEPQAREINGCRILSDPVQATDLLETSTSSSVQRERQYPCIPELVLKCV